MKKVFFRVDATYQMGTGHVMRCLTLAYDLQKNGVSVIFISRSMDCAIAQMIKGKKIELRMLPCTEPLDIESVTEYSGWLGVSQQIDAEQTVLSLKDYNNTDFLVVDHYAIDYRWEQVVANRVQKLVVIDDLANRIHHCDLLIDQNYYRDPQQRYLGLLPSNCVQFIGPQYVLLRSEFRKVRRKMKIRDGSVSRILVFFGGTDPTGETEKTLKALAQIVVKEIQVEVVVGASNPNKERIKIICNSNFNFHFHCQISNMAELMNEADLAIGAGGSTTWERCYLGLPSLTVVVARNQLQLTEEISSLGVTDYLGWYQDVSVEDYLYAIEKAQCNPNKLIDMSVNCLNLFQNNDDPEGLHPVTKYIVTSK